ncbi:MAG: Gfo/Idh/MocA family oxidoreductase, partial [Clostridia bacterium]|nr:Gfo/Idh/MocA family oxidoreductase [Clostridia bacterium]
MDKVRVAVVGIGCRGQYMLENCLLEMDNMCVTAVCDTYEDRTQWAVDAVIRHGQPKPFASTDWHDVLNPEIVDAVMIISSWESHVPIAVAAMEKGIAVGMEVGGAYSIDQCWEMVHAYERTGTPFMFLENCCYGRIEMMVMNMIGLGLFGEIVHCDGGYCHDLRGEIA